MNNYQIITDSCGNLPYKEAKQYNIDIISLYWIENGVEHLSYDPNTGTDFKDFYNRLRNKSIIKTSAVNTETFIEKFEHYLSKGIDILYLGFSSALSTTYASSVAAKKELERKYPERKIIVIDSLSASLGQGLLAIYSAINRDEGMSIEENAEWLENNKLRLTHFFTVDNLVYLYRGGRVAKSTYILGNALRIKPLLHVDDLGRLIPFGKVIGRKKSLQVLVDEMAKHGQDLENQIIAISHGDCQEDVDYVVSLINQKFKYKKLIINYVDQTVGAHSGPGTMALFSLSDNRHVN